MPGHMTGISLNLEWNVNAQHALYREDGRWYHIFSKFSRSTVQCSRVCYLANSKMKCNFE